MPFIVLGTEPQSTQEEIERRRAERLTRREEQKTAKRSRGIDKRGPKQDQSHRRRSDAERPAPDTRPCRACGFGDDAGTVRHCDACNTPYHDRPPCVSHELVVEGDWLCGPCLALRR